MRPSPVLTLMAALSVLAMALTASDAWAGGSAVRTPLPVVSKAKAGTQCVEPAENMRRNHMAYLQHQRDGTVRGGIRGAKYSLVGCIDCHAGARTASVAAGPGDFCVSCHRYAAVKLDCFECHTGKSHAVAGKGQP